MGPVEGLPRPLAFPSYHLCSIPIHLMLLPGIWSVSRTMGLLGCYFPLWQTVSTVEFLDWKYLTWLTSSPLPVARVQSFRPDYFWRRLCFSLISHPGISNCKTQFSSTNVYGMLIWWWLLYCFMYYLIKIFHSSFWTVILACGISQLLGEPWKASSSFCTSAPFTLTRPFPEVTAVINVFCMIP